MIALNVTGTEPNLLIQAGDTSVACIGLFCCNYGDTNLVFDLYLVPAGKSVPIFDDTGYLVSGDPECIFIKNKTLRADDTFFLNMEKILLHPGDAIYIKKYDDLTKLAVQVSFEQY